MEARLAFWKLCRSGEISEEKNNKKRSDVFGVKKRTWGRKEKSGGGRAR
jgi:hypothetical protein